MKITTFAQELLSVVLTPFVLWFSLPPCSTAIVDFFREFSVHVDGLGYVCSFAVFDFKRHGNVHVSIFSLGRLYEANLRTLSLQFGAPTETTDERYQSKEGKMEKSFLNFKVRVMFILY
jgi:autophagy-related protein 9